MAPLITVNDLREHVETDINDAALQAIIDAVDEEIVEAQEMIVEIVKQLRDQGDLN